MRHSLVAAVARVSALNDGYEAVREQQGAIDVILHILRRDAEAIHHLVELC